MKKAVFNKSGMKMLIDSGWKEFDRQTNCISTGNVIANTQTSLFIRPYMEQECNGFTFKPGELLAADLRHFPNLPERINSILRDKDRKRNVILYKFFTYRDGRVVPFGYVVTDYDHKLLDYVVVCGWRESWDKRYTALMECIKYICED